MHRARIQQTLEDPAACQTVAAKARHRTLEARLDIVRQYVEVREFQTRHVAALKIQRAFRVFLLRSEHALLLAESAVPDSATTQGLQQICDDRLALEELALVEDPALRLAHFLATMLAGVPLRKLRARKKYQPGDSFAWTRSRRSCVGARRIPRRPTRCPSLTWRNSRRRRLWLRRS